MLKQCSRRCITGLHIEIVAHDQNDVNIAWRWFGGDIAAEDNQPGEFACGAGKPLDLHQPGRDILSFGGFASEACNELVQRHAMHAFRQVAGGIEFSQSHGGGASQRFRRSASPTNSAHWDAMLRVVPALLFAFAVSCASMQNMCPLKSLASITCLVLLLGPDVLQAAPVQRIEETEFGKMPDGASVRLFTLRNSHGLIAKLITYGATLTELRVPDRNGATVSVVLGADNLEQYLKGFPAASVVGRVANRIAKASFTLDGVDHKLAANAGPNHIHGGRKGFAQVLWQAKPLPPALHQAAVQFTYLSKDGEEGYPGD